MNHAWAAFETVPYTCMICTDSGLHDKTGSWKFCLCPAGVALVVKDPGAADQANATARRLGLCAS